MDASKLKDGDRVFVVADLHYPMSDSRISAGTEAVFVGGSDRDGDPIVRTDDGEMYAVDEAWIEPYREHDCIEHATQYTGDGPLGHGFECAICRRFLQAG